MANMSYSAPRSAEEFRRQFARDGILFPLSVLTDKETETALANLAAFEAREGGRLGDAINSKPHLILPWISDLVRHPRILDAVETILGPDLLCWMSNFFTKDAGDGRFISWHQDSTYWALSSPDVVTAWVALTPSRRDNGCLQVIPGTHLAEQVPHRDTFGEGNMLSRGQEIAVEVNLSEAVDVVLQPGEMSLHHVRIFHGSEPNRSDIRRIGLAIRYIPTRVSQVGGRTTALLVRGEDRFGHFDPEPVPKEEFAPADLAFHAEAMRRLHALAYAGTERSVGS